uniref:Uncharacterized protein n=1 Tax=Anguilla anguilla TaxID=7936 RepID=A0A0E9P9P3_ANGAN
MCVHVCMYMSACLRMHPCASMCLCAVHVCI